MTASWTHRSGLAALALVGACSTSLPGGPGGPGGATTACNDGATRCTDNTFETCASGVYTTTQACGEACDPTLGCVTCVPGSAVCTTRGDSRVCRDDGSGYDTTVCDPVQGVTCEATSGLCEGACAPDNLSTSYIGCEYYPTVTGNPVGSTMHFAVAIANTTRTSAQVTIDGGALAAPVTLTVRPDSVEVQTLPWVDALKLCNSTASTALCGGPESYGALVPGGAYHLRATQPVTVYQFNPLEYTVNGEFSFTNDASLLLPANAWTGSYVVAAWRRSEFAPPMTGPSLLAVTASQDDTHVTIVVTADTVAAGGAPQFIPGVPQTVTLNQGDVLELASSNAAAVQTSDDLSGSMVSSDKPVQVIGGAFCAFVPNGNVGYCDHLEESMFSVESLSTRYLVTAPAVQRLPNGKAQVVRIIATQRNTTLTYDPPQAGAATTIALPGQYVDLVGVNTDFLITANHKVLVAQYMEGQEAGGNTGDPAMTLAVPVDQYRDEYLFHAPVNYDQNYVNITALDGATVKLDGMPVTGFTPIGQTGFGAIRVRLDNTGDGNHTIKGSDAFGITVYGYGQYTSYGYPGGLDLSFLARP